MRRLFLVITGLLVAAVVGPGLALRSESFVLGAAHWAVESFSGLRLELRNPRVDFYRGSLSADEIHLVPQSDEGPALLSLLDVTVDVPLTGVFGESPGGSFLRAGSIIVFVSESDNTADPEPLQWLGYLGWLPAELRIGQAHLVTASAETWIFPLKNVRGDRLDSPEYRLTAQADYVGEALDATVDLLALDRGWGAASAETRIKLSAPVSGSSVTLAGTLEGKKDAFHYDFHVSAFYRDISDFLRGFEGAGMLAGELRLLGTMAGDADGFVLSDATFLLNNTPDYAFQVGGKLTYKVSGETGIELEGLGELASLSHLVKWVDLDVADFGRAQSSVRLSGSLDEPVIDEFTLTTGNDAGLTVSMYGRLDLFETGADGDLPGNAIAVVLEGPALGVLRPWLGDLPIEPGPWRASAQLTGQRGILSLRDIELETGTPGVLELKASGAIGRITLPQESQETLTFTDILLSAHARVPDPAAVGALLDRDDIPPYQELNASLTIRGTGEELLLSDGRLSVSASDLQATVGPISAVLRPADTTALSSLAAPVIIELSDSGSLSKYTHRYTRQAMPVPVPGPLKFTARLTQKGAVFQLLDIVGVIGDGDHYVRAEGRIGNLASLSDVALTADINGLDTLTLLSSLLPSLPTDFDYAEPPGDVAGSFILTEKQGVWKLSKLALEAGDDSTPLSFTIDGEIDDLTRQIAVNLDSEFRVDDPDLLEALGGLPLKPLGGSLKIATIPGEVYSNLKVQIGETLIDGVARVAIGENGVESARLTLNTPHLHLQDFGFEQESEQQRGLELLQKQKDNRKRKREGGQEPEQDQKQEQESVPEIPAAGATSATLLTGLREKAPPFPVDVTLNIEGLSGDNSNIDRLRVRVSGVDNRYTLEQFSAIYDQALAEVRGVIDLNNIPPAISLAGRANALPLGAILADVGVNSNVSGQLTVLGGITMMGDDREELIGNLDGGVAVALEDAVIEGAAYDLLATDLLAWIYSGALTEKSTRLDCSMAKFQLRQGVATTESLYVESARMVATGKAKFDLVRRKMDLRVTPLSKSRLLQVPSEVRLKGDMNSPRAKISPVNAVADATSAALMLIPSLTLKLFGASQPSAGSYRPCQADLGD